jgi:hypothetical protein
MQNRELKDRLKTMESMYPEGTPIRDILKLARITIIDLEQEVDRLMVGQRDVPQ